MKGSSTEVLALFLRLSTILLTILKNIALSEKRRNMEYLGQGLKRHVHISESAYSLQISFPLHSRPPAHSLPVAALFHSSTCQRRRVNG